MGYVAKTLSSGEEILLVAKKHWCNYNVAILCSFLAFFLILVILMLPSPKIPYYVTEARLLALLVLILGLAFMEVLRNLSIEMVCTNKRVIQKRGVIKRNADELQISTIESLEIKQSVLGRIFGFGTLHFSGTGTSHVEFKKVKKPLIIKATIADFLEKYK